MNFNLQPQTGYNKGNRITASFIIPVVLLGAVFTLGLYLPLGYAVWLLFVIPLTYVSIRYRKTIFTNLVLMLCVILIAAEYFFSRSGIDHRIAFFNGITGIAIFIFITYILNYKKSLETRLIESENLFRMTFEQAGTGIVHMQTDGRWIRVNDKYCEIVGHSREELQNLTPSDITHPDDVQEDLKLKKKLLSGEISDYKMEKRYIRSDSSVAWTIFICTKMHDAASNQIYLVGVVEDITKRKLAEEEVKYNENLLKQTLELMPVGVLFMNKMGTTVRSNMKAREIWAVKNNDGTDNFENYKGYWADTGKLIEPHEWASARAIERGETSIDEQIEIECFDGSRKIILNSVVPLRDNSGKIMGAIIVNQDVTKLKEFERAIKLSEEKFRTMAESMPLIVWTAAPGGELDYSNQWGMEFSGMKLEEITGMGWLKILHPNRAAAAAEKWKETVQMGNVFEDTSLFRRHDGQYRWFLTRAVALKDNSGTTLKWFGTSTEIHDQKETERKLKKTLEKLERSNKDLEMFAYVASHDLQEPLRMVTNYMQLLSRKYKDKLDEDANVYIDFAVDGATRMNNLILDLLLYARVSTKNKKFEAVDLNTVVADVLRDLQLIQEESKAVINYTNLPTVMADDVQMRQLFQNLIANAVKFRGNAPPRIEIAAERNAKDWLICIKDNGIGIDPAQSERIFLVFQRLHQKDKYPGTGIGLAVCKKIIERHGGRIWVESAPGKGSTFFFTIPA